MKILFLVGCAEPGRDGVGDYTRILARQCEKLGHTCRIVSINDPYILDEPQISSLTWRFSNALKNKFELFALKKLAEEFSPDWISLQFVPYGFHPKGLPWRLGKIIPQIAPLSKLHIMFHETWTGPHIDASFKDRFYGRLQRILLKNILKKRPPTVTHTHASPYLYLLKSIGLNSKQLLLPSNIPISPKNDDAWLWERLSKKEIGLKKCLREQYLLVGVFGSLYPEWPTESFCEKIKLLAEKQGKKCILLSIGHIGAGAPTWNAISHHEGKQLSIISLGGLDEEKVSIALKTLDFGVAALPWSLIEKGSSVSTLLAHGIPVLVPRDDIHFKFPTKEPSNKLLLKISTSVDDIIAKAKKTHTNDPAETITRQFLSDLETR